MYSIRFDMRAPAFGAPTTDLYAAAIDMSGWADQHGCLAVVLCEHHCCDDGYLPAPFVLASAIAARTQRLMLNLTAVLPLYEPVRLAEYIAVLDVISKGRASYVYGLGYRPEEFKHFGLSRAHRGPLADHHIDVLRAALPGGPAMMWGGASLAAARRAGRYGLGLLANGNVAGMRETYEATCREYGFEPGFVLLPEPDTPVVTFVADDVDAAWDELGQYLLHDAREYAKWNPDNDTSAGITRADSVDELRRKSTSHRILSVAEAITAVGAGEMLNLSPLCGGMPPDIAWPYLIRVGEVVLSGISTKGN